MNENKLFAEKRLETGKGPSRRLRMNDNLPAVIYAKGQKTLPITVSPKETVKLLKGPLKRNTLINLNIKGDPNSRTVMVKERQLHPTKRVLTHIDFVEVDLNKPVVVAVPIKLFGKSESVTLGGKLEHVLQKIRVSCLPKDIPEQIDLDISHFLFGSTHTKEVPLPKKVTLHEKPRVVVLTIKKPRGAAKEEESPSAASAATTAAAPAASKAPTKGK